MPARPHAPRVVPLRQAVHAFFTTEDGPTAVEYAAMLALILAGIIGAVGTVGGGTGDLFNTTEAEMNAAGMG